jgi:flagellar basal-body rod protein FlgB
MSKALDAYSKRFKAIAENIANVNTPNYRPKEVKFEELFKSESAKFRLKASAPGGNSLGFDEAENSEFEMQQEIQNIPQPEEYFAGNSHTNIDKEMSKLAETQIRFRFVSRLIKRYFSGLNSAITGTREG